jgi:hypothetical protein
MFCAHLDITINVGLSASISVSSMVMGVTMIFSVRKKRQRGGIFAGKNGRKRGGVVNEKGDDLL